MAGAEKEVLMKTEMTTTSTPGRRDPETTAILLKDTMKTENVLIERAERVVTVKIGMILTVNAAVGLITKTTTKMIGMEDIILILSMKITEVRFLNHVVLCCQFRMLCNLINLRSHFI